MPARIVVVHGDQQFVRDANAAFAAAGHSVAPFRDPMLAWDAIAQATAMELLITAVDFGPGAPNGVALASHAKFRKPGSRVIFAGLPEEQGFAGAIGEFLPMPVNVAELVDAAHRLLNEGKVPR